MKSLVFASDHLGELLFLFGDARTERMAFFAAVPDGETGFRTVAAVVAEQTGRGAHVELTDDGDDAVLEFVARQRLEFGQEWVLVCAHTHPSMSTTPSGTDREMWAKWAGCGEAVAAVILNPALSVSAAMRGAHASLCEMVDGGGTRFVKSSSLVEEPLKLLADGLDGFADALVEPVVVGKSEPLPLPLPPGKGGDEAAEPAGSGGWDWDDGDSWCDSCYCPPQPGERLVRSSLGGGWVCPDCRKAEREWIRQVEG